MITVQAFLDGVQSIYDEQPKYKIGHDGSDGYCDCIGLVKGALERAREKNINLHGTNQAARDVILNLKKIVGSSDLKLGQVVLKVRDKDDKSYPLPNKYRGTGNETNYTHIGVVTGVYPLEITHMTSPTAKKDTSVKNWAFVGDLPYIKGEKTMTASVYADSGGTVNVRASASSKGKLIEKVPVGSEVEVLEFGDGWSRIRYGNKIGFMMNKYLSVDEKAEDFVTVKRSELQDIYKRLGEILKG